jgi:hypothetical protein
MLCTETAERLAAVIPDAKFIMILRHPVDRFYSECVASGVMFQHCVFAELQCIRLTFVVDTI